MKNPVPVSGFVAILDALGAATYSETMAPRFLQTRRQVLNALKRSQRQDRVEGALGPISGTKLKTFTFGDTVLIAYVIDGDIGPKAPTRFFRLLRHFLVDALAEGVLFRGAVGVGNFFVDDRSNTVIGEAVADAASWYEKADWLGVVATPRTTLRLEGIYGPELPKTRWAFVRYDVPIKGAAAQSLLCVNWPRMFLVDELRPRPGSSNPRQRLLQCLERQSIPAGTESKYFHTLSFFDHVSEVERTALASRNRGRKPVVARMRRTRKTAASR